MSTGTRVGSMVLKKFGASHPAPKLFLFFSKMSDIPRKASVYFDGQTSTALDVPITYSTNPPFEHYRVDLVVNVASVPPDSGFASSYYICTNVHVAVRRDPSAEDVVTYVVPPNYTNPEPLDDSFRAGGPALDGAWDLNYGTSYSMFASRDTGLTLNAPVVGGEYREVINLSRDARGSFQVRARLVVPNTVSIPVIYRIEIIMTEIDSEPPAEYHIIRARELQADSASMPMLASPLNVALSTATSSLGPNYSVFVKAFGGFAVPLAASDPIEARPHTMYFTSSFHRGRDMVDFPLAVILAPAGRSHISRSYRSPIEYCAGRGLTSTEVITLQVFGQFVLAGEVELTLVPSGALMGRPPRSLLGVPQQMHNYASSVGIYPTGTTLSSGTQTRTLAYLWKNPFPEETCDVVVRSITVCIPKAMSGLPRFFGTEICNCEVTHSSDVSGDRAHEQFPSSSLGETSQVVKRSFVFYAYRFPNEAVISDNEVFYIAPFYKAEEIVLARGWRGNFQINVVANFAYTRWASRVSHFFIYYFIPRR